MHAVKSRTDSDVADEEVAKMRRAMAAEAKAHRESESRMHARANAELRRRLDDVGGRTSTTATPRRRGRGRSTALSSATSGGAASASTDTSSVPAASLPPTEGLSRSVVDVGRLGGNVYYGVGYVATDSLRRL
jgi:membrane protein involved in colicin uptake